MRRYRLRWLCLLLLFSGAFPMVGRAMEGAPEGMSRASRPGPDGGSDPLLDREAPIRPAPSTQRGNSLVLVYDDKAAERVVRQAVTLWQACRKTVPGMPKVVAFADSGRGDGGRWNDLGDRRLNVEVADLSNDRRCGAFRGQGIQVFRRARKKAGGLRSCGSLGQNLAHEIGHAFGLDDHPREVRWQNAIMSRLHPGNLFSRRVEISECRDVDELWQTDDEVGRLTAGLSIPDRSASVL